MVGSGCLFTLQKWCSRISSCSSVRITGFSMAISSWGRAMGPGTAERAWCHCSSWEWPVGATLAEPQICHPYPHQPPPRPQLWPLAAAGLNSLPKGMPGSSAGSTSPQQLLSHLLTAASTRQQCPALSCLTILSWQEAAGCSALPWCCIYSQCHSHGNDSCLQPYLGLGVT